MAAPGYRGTIALRQLVTESPVAATALALTCWDDSFVLHGIQPLPTPPASDMGRVSPNPLEATTNIGSKHRACGGGAHGHPRLLWHVPFESALPAEADSLTLSVTMADATGPVSIHLRDWPPVRHEAPTQAMPSNPTLATTWPDEAGRSLPDRVVALGADLGVVAGVRHALTALYCWPTWFLMIIEARDPAQSLGGGKPTCATPEHVWQMEDERGNRYRGRWRGGWRGPARLNAG